MPRGGAYADCAEQWSLGILGSSPPPPEWLVEERSHRTVVQEMRVEAPRGGSASTLRVGVWCVHASPRDNRRAKFPTREKGRRPHASHHTTPRACSARTARTHSRRTSVTSYRASSLLGSHPKKTCATRHTRDAERRVAQRSTAQHSAAQRSTACASGTCATHARVRRVHGTQHSVTPLHTPDARAQVPFCLASTFHRPPTLLRGFLRSVPFCTALYRAGGCGVSTPRRGTTDAQSSPRAKKVVVHMHRTTRHRERAPHELRARTHGAQV